MNTQIQNTTLAISFAFLAIILYYVDWQLIAEKSHLISISSVLSATLVYILFMASKVLRFSAMIPKVFRPNFSTLYYVMTKHAYYLSVLPLRLGDFYFSSLLKQHTQIPHRIGNLSLILVRIYDVLILCLFTLVGLIYIKQSMPDIIYIAIIGLSIFFLLILLTLSRSLRLLGKIVKNLTQITFWANRIKLLQKFQNGLSLLEEEFKKHNKKSSHVVLLTSSILNWFGSVLMFWFVLNMFQLEISLIESTFFVGMVNLVSLVPIQTIGGFGLRETGLLSALIISGMSYQESISYAVIARFILYLIQLLSCMLIMLFFRIFMKSRIKPI